MSVIVDRIEEKDPGYGIDILRNDLLVIKRAKARNKSVQELEEMDLSKKEYCNLLQTYFTNKNLLFVV
ncbi:MAG: hypothetical protein JKX76_02475 [Colwellia sp.]|nr:hypothetical protein [Colwellia sp.]